MKRYIRQLIILVTAMIMAAPNVVAQVDLQRSFYVMHNDSTGVTGKLEGGEWLIRFSDVDSLGNQFSSPVAMNIEATYYGDTTYVEMQTVDSVLFEVPADEMKPGVFELTEEHFKYIIGSDSATIIRFRIDCLTKVDLPKVGQKVLCNIFRDYLPFGFVGQVESVKASYDLGYVEMKCKQIPLKEVYSKFYKAGFYGSDSLNSEAKRRGGFVAPPRRLDPLNRTVADTPTKVFQKEVDVNAHLSLLHTKEGGFNFMVSNSDAALSSSLDKVYGNAWRKYELLRIKQKITGGVGCYYTAIIDVNGEKDYTAVWYETSLSVEFSPMLTIHSPFKSSHLKKLVEFPIPIPIPGLVLTTELGGKISFDASAAVGFNFRMDIKDAVVGLTNDGVKSRPIMELCAPKNPGGLDFSADGRLYLKGSFFGGAYAKFGIGIGGKIAEIDAGLSAGLTASANIDVPLQFHDNFESSWSYITGSGMRYDDLLTSSALDLALTFRPEGSVSLADDYIRIDLIQALNDLLGVDLKFSLPLYKLKSFPKLSNPRFEPVTDDLYVFKLDREKSFFGSNIGYFVKDVSIGVDDSSFPLFRSDAESYNGNGTCSFNVPIEPNFRGKIVHIYPYLQTTFLGDPISETYVPNVFVEKYIPFIINIKPIRPNYEQISVEGVIEGFDACPDDFWDNYDLYCYVYDSKKSFKTKIRVPVISGELDFEVLGSEVEGTNEGFMSLCIEDVNNNEKSESKLEAFKFLDKYTPLVIGYEELSTSRVVLKSELNSVFVHQVKNGQELNAEVGFHIHEKYTGANPRDLFVKAISIPFGDDNTYWMEVVDLKPATHYEFYPIVKREGKTYKGEVESFVTHDIVENLDAMPMRYNSAILFADIAKSEDFKTTSFHFQISKSKTDWTDHIKAYPYDHEWDFGKEGEYYGVSTEVVGLKENTTYYYRVSWERNNGTMMTMPDTPLEFKTPKKQLDPITGDAKVDGNKVTLKATLTNDFLDEYDKYRDQDVVFYVSKNRDALEEGPHSNPEVMSRNLRIYPNVAEYECVFEDLQYERTYYYMVSIGRIPLLHGNIKSFTTKANPIESQACETLPATVSDNQVVLCGKMDALTLGLYKSGNYPNAYFGFAVSANSDMSNSQEVITFHAEETSGLFQYETTALPAGHTYYYNAFLQLTGSEDKIYSTNGPVEFTLEKQDGDLIIPDAKKRERNEEEKE